MATSLTGGKPVWVKGVTAMKKKVKTIDFSGELIFLGTGTSVGVPAIGCGCPVCVSDNPKNKRFRSSIALGLPEGNLLIDTTPDLRMQLLRENIGVIDAEIGRAHV